jgi:isopentenyl-diphosphate delta-isomerase
MADISRRKDDHLDLATSGDVGFKQTTTLFEHVRLIHDALPELAVDELDTSVELMGKRLRAPILIAGMTGGSDRALRINKELAGIAEERGYAFGLGSQRAMHKHPGKSETYTVRDVAPSALLLGNLGIVQAAQMPSDDVKRLVDSVGADALCVHLNPAMELIQDEGDRDFRGGLATLERLLNAGLRLVVKETGCGLSASVAARVRALGVEYVDTSGAGGTSWVAVETHRASEQRRPLGQAFWEWGIPTAASVALCAPYGFRGIFATGGINSGVDIAKAIALGASAGGIARRALQAVEAGGKAGGIAFFERIETELRTTMLLTGSRDLKALAKAPRLISGELAQWLQLANG